ncbi:MAG: hypothetical protein KJ949_02020 [Nanoarchaeota archaeon]|nr:hypothetical protein [Nanoarchaeota archaeon]MBU4308755.1 hypothetical protein [Nanoarchaeota archaeon]
MNKEIKIILSKELEKQYEELNKIISNEIKKGSANSFHQTLFKAINKTKELLKINPFYGNPISKKLIPKEFIKKYEVDNLWRVELPGYWRMLYSITGNEIKIICFILKICDHKKYNKLFGYKRK